MKPEKSQTDLVKGISLFFKDEASKLFNTSNPHKWEFKRIRGVGAFKLELFGFGVVSAELGDDWTARIQQGFELTANRNVFQELQFITNKIEWIRAQEDNEKDDAGVADCDEASG